SEMSCKRLIYLDKSLLPLRPELLSSTRSGWPPPSLLRGPCRPLAPSRPPFQKPKPSGFEDLIADREHVVSPRNIKQLSARNQLGEGVCGARDRVLGADRDQHRRAERSRLGGRQRLARATDACGERLAVRV